MKKGCIRQIEPSCPYEAVIPTLTVEDKSNIKDLADCFVHVSNINTTFYIDDKHRMIVTWAGPVEYDNYDLDANTLGLRSQFLVDNTNEILVYYDKTGAYQKYNYSENSENSGDVYTITIADGIAGFADDYPFERFYNDSDTWEAHYLATRYIQYEYPSGSSESATEVFTITNSNGDIVSLSDLFALKDSLLKSRFKFTTTLQYSNEDPVNILLDVVPSNITVEEQYEGTGFIISGMFNIDERTVTEHPNVIHLAPLRWSLYIEEMSNSMVAEFTVEKVVCGQNPE